MSDPKDHAAETAAALLQLKAWKQARHELQYASEIAREAGALLRGFAERGVTWERKLSDIDLVTEADRAAEDLIVSRLTKEFPSHGILAEEGSCKAGAGVHRWIIDPLDGTTNFAHGFPHYGVSIALEENGVIVCGVVYDVSMGELFAAQRGLGAWNNGKALHVSKVADLGMSLLATGFPYDRRTSPLNNLDHFSNMKPEVHGIRRGGSASLDLCYVAAGRLDGYWEMKLKPWDVAAGALVVHEAGGQLSDLRGGEFDWSGAQTVASNGLVHDAIVAVLQRGLLP